MKKRSCIAVSLTLLTPALLAGCSKKCDPKVDPNCRPNGSGGYYRPYFGGGGFFRSNTSGSRPASGVSNSSGRGGFGSFGGGGRSFGG